MAEVTFKSIIVDPIKQILFFFLCSVFDVKIWVAGITSIILMAVSNKYEEMIIRFFLDFFSATDSFQPSSWLGSLMLYSLVIIVGIFGLAGLINCLFRIAMNSSEIEKERWEKLEEISENNKTLDEDYKKAIQQKEDYKRKFDNYSVDVKLSTKYTIEEQNYIKEYLSLIDKIGIDESNSDLNTIIQDIEDALPKVKTYLDRLRKRSKYNLFDVNEMELFYQNNRHYDEDKEEYKKIYEQAKNSYFKANSLLERVRNHLSKIERMRQLAAIRRLEDLAGSNQEDNVLPLEDEDHDADDGESLG